MSETRSNAICSRFAEVRRSTGWLPRSCTGSWKSMAASGACAATWRGPRSIRSRQEATSHLLEPAGQHTLRAAARKAVTMQRLLIIDDERQAELLAHVLSAPATGPAADTVNFLQLFEMDFFDLVIPNLDAGNRLNSWRVRESVRIRP